MKKIAALLSSAFLVCLTTETIKADVLADWTFQTSASTNNIIATGKTPNATQSGIAADFGSGTASASHATAGTAWSIPSGNGSSNSWSANNWLSGDYFQFSVSTIGFHGLTISYSQVGSATGPGLFNFQYSTDGSTFTPVGSSYSITSSPSWNPNTASGAANESFAFDLSAISALDNVSAAYFRVVDQAATLGGAINLGNVGTGGTGRIDDFLVSASPIPEPASLALAALSGFAVLGRSISGRRRSK